VADFIELGLGTALIVVPIVIMGIAALAAVLHIVNILATYGAGRPATI
jgi:hypothetical protein